MSNNSGGNLPSKVNFWDELFDHPSNTANSTWDAFGDNDTIWSNGSTESRNHGDYSAVNADGFPSRNDGTDTLDANYAPSSSTRSCPVDLWGVAERKAQLSLVDTTASAPFHAALVAFGESFDAFAQTSPQSKGRSGDTDEKRQSSDPFAPHVYHMRDPFCPPRERENNDSGQKDCFNDCSVPHGIDTYYGDTASFSPSSPELVVHPPGYQEPPVLSFNGSTDHVHAIHNEISSLREQLRRVNEEKERIRVMFEKQINEYNDNYELVLTQSSAESWKMIENQKKSIDSLQTELQYYKQIHQMNEDKHQCCICLDRSRIILFQPCYHCCVCKECSDNMVRCRVKECPICKREITKRIYIIYP